MYRRIILWWLLLGWANVFADGNGITLNNVRSFPAGTVYATIVKINYPQVTLQEIPSNWGSSLLGMMLLASQKVTMSPASIIRDDQNNTHVQVYLDELKDQPVAVQLDYQGRVWVIWQLTTGEVKWVLQNKLNSWNKVSN